MIASRRYEHLWPCDTEGSEERTHLVEPLWVVPVDPDQEDGETLEDKWDNLIHQYVHQSSDDLNVLTSILDFKLRGHIDDIVYSGENLLHIASRKGMSKSVHCLLQNSANCMSIDLRNGNNPLHCSAIGGHADCIDMLLFAGANPYVKNFSADKTPLHYAAQYGYDKCVELLLTRCASPDMATQLVNARDINGHTALHLACIDGNLDSVRWLLKHHADVLLVDEECRSAHDIASTITNRDAILRELAKHLPKDRQLCATPLYSGGGTADLAAESGGLFDGLNVATKASKSVFSLFDGLHVKLSTAATRMRGDSPGETDRICDPETDHSLSASEPDGRWVGFQGKKFLLDRESSKVIVHRDRYVGGCMVTL